MKKLNSLKLMGMLVLVVSFAVGCAGTTEEATTADEAAAAISAAKAANAKAKAEGYQWRDTGKLIKKAEKALKAGNAEKAIKLANKAKRQAELAVQQKYDELDRLKKLGIIEGGPARPMQTSGSYEVVKGDNLWDISAKPSIYGNPYEWPLIYKANSDKIKDADLIYPGQVLGIDTNPSASEVDAAIRHAKTRGSWSLGVVEESDKAYLGQ
jgi:nucleoid-associated protein YgaU